MAGLLETIRAQESPMYGVFDAARDAAVYGELVRSKLAFRSLYENPDAARYIDVAPYLVYLDPEADSVEDLVNRAEGESWAIFLSSAAAFEDIRHHLRKFVKVELEGRARAVFFRFYDPRVFRDMIPQFDGEQLERFFELPEYYICESEAGIDRYRFDGEQLEIVPASREES